MKFRIDAEVIKTEMERMLSCGPRLTGSDGHRKYVDYIKSRLKEMGLNYYADPFFFRRWEETGKLLELLGAEPVPVPVASAHPYSGETPAEGITEELVLLDSKFRNLNALKGKIAVVEFPNMEFLPAAVAFDKRSAWPEDLTLPARYDGPVATTFVKNFYGKLCKKAGAKAAVFVWENISDDMIQGQYLPFVLGYQDIPILWVNETNGKSILEAARAHRQARLRLTADIEENALAETVYCIVPGRNRRECVVINTHTDGPNCVEENGPAALLAILEQLKDQKPERTHIFLFTAGHFRLAEFADESTGGVQASSRWLAMHRALWDGINGHMKAVCTLTLEHLGSMEWATIDGKYTATGKIQPELVYTGNAFVDRLYMDEVKQNRTLLRTMTLRGHNGMHFGEGQNFAQAGIPDIALCTAPDYLCVASENQETDKFSLDLMVEQTQTFANLAAKLETIPAAVIGRADKFSRVAAHNPANGMDWTAEAVFDRVMHR